MPGHLRRRSLVLTLTLLIGAAVAPQSASAAAPAMATADDRRRPRRSRGTWRSCPTAPCSSPSVPGRVRVYSSGAVGASLVRTITIPSVRAEGEAGLMGIAVDVDFASNRFVYVCASRLRDQRQLESTRCSATRSATTGSWIERHRAARRHARQHHPQRLRARDGSLRQAVDRHGRLRRCSRGAEPEQPQRQDPADQSRRQRSRPTTPSSPAPATPSIRWVIATRRASPSGRAPTRSTPSEHGPDVERRDQPHRRRRQLRLALLHRRRVRRIRPSGCGPADELPESALGVGRLRRSQPRAARSRAARCSGRTTTATCSSAR